MSFLNIEIKAQCQNQETIEYILRKENAVAHGTDFQTDTYFKVNEGRLKLREGNIENALIHYHREDKPGPKNSQVVLYKALPDENLKRILTASIGVKVVVKKERRIFFIENIKFHLDKVEGLGTFVEIEAIDLEGNIGKEKLLEQCQRYLEKFKIKDDELVSISYSDMLLKKLVKNEN
ncbi:MAG: class IV adenylate cyclase [Bacteroidales bacterium]